VELGRWLGVRPPSPITKALADGSTVLDAILDAVRQAGPLDGPAQAIADAVGAGQAIELVGEMFETHEVDGEQRWPWNLRDGEVDYASLTEAEKKLFHRELGRRKARTIALGTEILARVVEAPALFEHVASRVGRQAAPESYKLSLGAILLAAAAPPGQASPKLAEGTAEALSAVAGFRDFAEPIRALVATCSARDREHLVQYMCTDDDTQAGWLYFDLLDDDGSEQVARYYNFLPDAELTAEWIARVGEREPARVKKVLGFLAEQYAGERPFEGRREDAGEVRVVEFDVPGGERIKLWASPRLETVLDRAAWPAKG
jgi:hypothetical protein